MPYTLEELEAEKALRTQQPQYTLEELEAEKARRQAPAPRRERTLLGTGISAVLGGGVDAVELLSRAGRGIDQPGGADIVRGIGDIGVRATKALKERFPILEAAPDEGAIPQGIRSAIQSIFIGGPLAVGGYAAGSVPGAATAFAGGSAAIYGLAEKDRFIEEAHAAMDAGIAPRISDEELNTQANKAALAEGGLELLSNSLGFVFSGAGKLFKKPLKGALAPTIREAFLKITPKTAAVTTGKIAAEEIPTEVAQEEIGAKLRRDIGVPAPEFGEGISVVPATTVSSIIFAGIGMGVGGLRRSRVIKALDNPDMDAKRRIDAVDAVASEMGKVDPATAATWKEKAYGAVARQEAIPDDISALTTPTAIPDEQITEQPPVEPVQPTGALARAAALLDDLGVKTEPLVPEIMRGLPPAPERKALGRGAIPLGGERKPIVTPVPMIQDGVRIRPDERFFATETIGERTLPTTKIEEAAKVQAIAPDELVNSITRKEAGDMLAKGDTEVIRHIAEGVLEKGRPQVEDAIRNESLGRVAKTPKGDQREQVKDNIIALESELNRALEHPEEVVAEKTKTIGERRSDDGLRRHVQDLMDKGDTEGAYLLIYEDPLTGLLNSAAWKKVEPEAQEQNKIFASMDISGLGWVNDTFGHSAGDTLLKTISSEIKKAGIKGYRKGGDEIAGIFDNQAEADILLRKAQDAIANKTIEVETPDGKKYAYTGWRLDYGTGQSFGKADATLYKGREEQIKAGYREPRKGAKPHGVVEAVPKRIETDAQGKVNLLSPKTLPTDIVTKSGTPYPSEENALRAGKLAKLSEKGYSLTPVEGGFVWRKTDQVAEAGKAIEPTGRPVEAVEGKEGEWVKDAKGMSFEPELKADIETSKARLSDLQKAAKPVTPPAAKKTIADIRKDKFLTGKIDGLNKLLSEGWKPVAKELTDTAATKKMEVEYNNLRRNAPIGNKNHIDTIRMYELGKKLDNGIKKTIYRLEKDNTIKDISKTEYDYLQGEVKPATPPVEKAAVFNFKDEVRQRHPGLTDEDISAIATETAAQFEQVAARSQGRAKGIAEDASKAWNKFAETGELPIAKKGQFVGQPKTFGDDEFYKQAIIHRKRKEAEGNAPDEVEGLDLNVGDTFTVKGEEHKVISETEDGKLKIQNGTTQYVWPGETVEIDRNSLKKAEITKEEPTPPAKGKDQEMFAGVSKAPLEKGLKTEKAQAEKLLEGFESIKPEEDKQAGLFEKKPEVPKANDIREIAIKEASETRKNVPQVSSPIATSSINFKTITLEGEKTVKGKLYELPGYDGPQLAVVTYKSPRREGYRVYLPKSGVLLQDNNGVATLEDTLKIAVKRVVSLRDTVKPEAKPIGAGEVKTLPFTRAQIGKSPTPYKVLREIEATAAEKELGERFFEVENEQTGEIETVEFQDLKGIREKADIVAESLDKLKAIGKDQKGSALILMDIAETVYDTGMSFNSFLIKMKTALGDTFAKFKNLMMKVYQGAKAKFKEERGSWSRKPIGKKSIKLIGGEIKEAGVKYEEKEIQGVEGEGIAAKGIPYKETRVIEIPYGEGKVTVPLRLTGLSHIFPETAVTVQGFLGGELNSIRTSLQNVPEKVKIYLKHGVTGIEVFEGGEAPAFIRGEGARPVVHMRQDASSGEWGAQTGLGANARFLTSGKVLEEVMKKAKVMAPGYDIRVIREGQPPLYIRGTQGAGFTIPQVNAVINPIMKNWKNAPAHKVVPTFSELPTGLQDSMRAAGEPDTIMGLFNPPDKTVYFIADRLSSAKNAEEVLFHEALGHFGLRGLMGNNIKPLLNVVWREKNTEARAIAAKYELDIDAEGVEGQNARQTAAEELLAKMAQEPETPPLLRRVIAAVRNWMRRVGFNIKLSDNDLKKIIYDAAQYVRTGEKPMSLTGLTAYSRREGVSPFYSQLKKVLSAQLPDDVTPTTFNRVIAANREGIRGIKPEEIADAKATVAAIFGNKKTMPKQEILDYLDATDRTDLQDVVLGEETTGAKGFEVVSSVDGYEGEWDVIDDAGNVRFSGTSRQSAVDYLESEKSIVDRTQFSSYQMPGEIVPGSYREQFVTAKEAYKGRTYDEISQLLQNFEEYPAGSEKRNSLIAERESAPDTEHEGWQDGHPQYSSIVNPIVRIRYNDRTDSEGNLARLIEELQGPSKENEAKMPEIYKKYKYQIGLKRILEGIAKENVQRKAEGKPLIASLSWTPGSVQAERYDLSKQIDSIGYQKRGGNYNITVWDKDGKQVWQNQSATKEDVANTVGKEILQRMEDGVGEQGDQGIKFLQGLDLKVGGEGLKRLYDETIPKFLNKYGEEFGMKVGESKILPDGMELLGGKYRIFDKGGSPQWFKTKKEAFAYGATIGINPISSIPITPAMSASILHEGQPVFARKDGEISESAPKEVKSYYDKLTEDFKTTKPIVSKGMTKWKEFWIPFSSLGAATKKEVLESRGLAMGFEERALDFIKRLQDRLNIFDDDAKKAVFRYLDGKTNIEDVPVEAQRIAKSIKERTKTIGRMLVKRGIISQEVYDKMNKGGGYIHYMYARHLLGDDAPIGITSTGKLDLNYTIQRIDPYIIKNKGPQKEYIDKNIYEGLLDTVERLGLDYRRVLNAGRSKLGYAQEGGKTVIQYATDAQVFAHEVGHQLDFKYDLWTKIVREAIGLGKKGEPTKTATAEKRGAIQKELRDLSDLTWEGQDVSKFHKAKVRKKPEKMAHMLEAYIHAPERFKEVAPTVYESFDGFLKSKEELKPISGIKAGLSLISVELTGYQVVSKNKNYSKPGLSLDEANKALAKAQEEVDQYRKELGLIEDASVAVPVGMGKALVDIGKFDHLKKLAENSDITWMPSIVEIDGKKMGIGKLAEEVKHYEAVASASPDNPDVQKRYETLRDALSKAEEETRNIPGDYKQLPTSKKYGPLAGAFVKKPVANDLVPLFSAPQTEMGTLFQKLVQIEETGMSLFKAMHVALNFPTAFRNIISNVLQINMSGRGLAYIPGDIVNAIKSMKAGDADFVQAKKNGLFKSSWAATEINEILDVWTKAQKGGYPSILQAVSKMAKYYGKIDDISKLALFVQQRAEGKSVPDAAAHAMKWGMDYSLASRSVKGLRRHIIPFLSYQYKIAPLIAESLAKRPWVIGKFAVVLPLIMAEAAKSLNDIDDDEWEKLKKQLPYYMKKSGSYHVIPFRDPEGRWQWVNLEYYFPWGNWLNTFRDMKEGDLKEFTQDVGIGNPFLDLLQAAKSGTGGKPPSDPFTGKPIYSELDSPSDQWLKLSAFLVNKWAPSMVAFKPGREKLGALEYTLGIGESDKWGREITPAQAAGRWFGFNIVAVSPQQTAAIKGARIKELQAERARLLSDRSISIGKRRDIVKRYRDKIIEIGRGG